jgi:hypothetical protein
MVAVTKVKNADYAGHGKSAFANFTLVEDMGFLSTEEGFVTRMTDKLSRLMTFIRKGILVVKGEGVRDALMDLANYCVLLAGYIDSKKEDDMSARVSIEPSSAERYRYIDDMEDDAMILAPETIVYTDLEKPPLSDTMSEKQDDMSV